VTATLSAGTTVVAEEFYFGHGCVWVRHAQGWSPIASHDWTWLERKETITITRHLGNVQVVPHAYEVGATYSVRSPEGIHDIWSKSCYGFELRSARKSRNCVVSDILQSCFARDGLKVSAWFYYCIYCYTIMRSHWISSKGSRVM